MQAAIVAGTQRQPRFRPIVLPEVQRGRRPEIRKCEVPAVLGIECRAMRNLRNGAIFGSDLPVNLAMINRVLIILRRRPWEYEYIVPFARANLGSGGGGSFFRRNLVNCDEGVVLLTPLLGRGFEPRIELRHKMRPFGDS